MQFRTVIAFVVLALSSIALTAPVPNAAAAGALSMMKSEKRAVPHGALHMHERRTRPSPVTTPLQAKTRYGNTFHEEEVHHYDNKGRHRVTETHVYEDAAKSHHLGSVVSVHSKNHDGDFETAPFGGGEKEAAGRYAQKKLDESDEDDEDPLRRANH